MVIIHPLKPRIQAKRVLAVIAGIWMSSAAIAVPTLIYAKAHTWTFCDGSIRTICYIDWPGDDVQQKNTYDLA